MIIIILVCLGYGTSTHLTDAYGLTGQSVLYLANNSRHSHDCDDDASGDSDVLCLGIYLDYPSWLSSPIWND